MADEFTTSRFESDDDEVTRALSGLKRVDAPKDFDFKVKARIASGRAGEQRSLFPLWAKAALPLALVLGVGGFMGLRYASDPENVLVPPVAVAEVPIKAAPQITQPTATQPAPAVMPASNISRPDTSVVASSRKTQLKPKQATGGSIDSAVTVANSIELKDVPLSDALQQAGVSGKLDNGSVKVDSADAKSGLKTGDVIESVNGKAVEPGSTIKGRLAGKTLRVRRDGKIVEIVVKN